MSECDHLKSVDDLFSSHQPKIARLVDMDLDDRELPTSVDDLIYGRFAAQDSIDLVGDN